MIIKIMFKKIWKLIGKNSNQIQALMIIGLVVVTLIYAVSTKEMANTMSKDFELSNRPYVALNEINRRFNDHKDKLKLVAILENKGKSPARIVYMEKEILGKTSTHPVKKEQILYPEETREQGLFTLMDEEINKKQFFRFKIIYSSLSREQKKEDYCIEHYCEYDGNPNHNIISINSTICE